MSWRPRGRSRWISVSSGLSPAWSSQRYKVRPCQMKQRQSQQNQKCCFTDVIRICAVWNVRTSFSGFHEVKCLPPHQQISSIWGPCRIPEHSEGREEPSYSWQGWRWRTHNSVSQARRDSGKLSFDSLTLEMRTTPAGNRE